MMKTITKLIVPGRGMHYFTGMLLLILSMAIPQKSSSQCVDNAKNACDKSTPIIIQLDENDAFQLLVSGDFYDSIPPSCNIDDFMMQVRDVVPDTLITDFDSSGPNFRNDSACRYVGKKLKAELFYNNGVTMISVCERPVILLPQIQCTDTTLYCNHPVFESTMDKSILPLKFGCDGFDASNLKLEIIHEFWDDMTNMDTLFRIWEVSTNNNKGVVTCTDTIVREAIPIADIIFPADDTISCESWDGLSPNPLASGRPYFLINVETPEQDTVYLDATEVQHCIKVSYTDETLGRYGCEVEKYLRYWTIRVGEIIRKDTQMITVLDTLGPLAEFRFSPVETISTIIDGDTVIVPVFQISTGAHGCESDGNLPVLYATDECSGVAKVSATVKDGDGIVYSLVNGGPFMGFEEGKYLVKYTAADSCWNESEYYVWIKVVDRINPVVSLGVEYNITLSNEVTWLNLQDFAKHHISDNCGLEIVVGRRIGDHATACNADDSTSIVGMYKQKYADWLENDGWNCTELVNVDSGWMDKIPFCCADLGSKIMIEIMAIDQSCNVTRGMTLVVPIDKGGATLFERLPDVTLACEAWNENYHDLIYGDSLPNNLNIDSLNKYFGTYLPYVPGENVESSPILVEDKDCYIVDGVLVTEESIFKTHNGLFRASCAGNLTQEAELVYDEGCNTFTILRHFLINGHEIAVQKITTEIRCPFTAELFEYPAKTDTMITIADTGILYDPSYWVGNRFNLTTEGPVYNGSDCRVIAIGYVDKLLDRMYSKNPNEADAVILRTWCMADWCSSDLGPDWKSSIGKEGIIIWTQNIKLFVDPLNPDISIEKPDPEKVDEVVISPPVSKDVFEIKGQIRTEDALNVNNVTVEVRTSDHSENMVTNESGSFEMKVDKGSQVKITPVKKGDLGNGLSTLDLILIQRHLLRKKLITSPYKLIAADANNDKKLTPADVLFLRRVILNKMEGLSEAESWKFVDANYTFINQKAAYAENYPTELDVEQISKDLESSFVAVKLGDVNQSVNVSRSSSRSERLVTALNIEDRILKPGEIIDVPLNMTEKMNLTGMQFALRFDDQSVDVLSVQSNSLDLDDEHWTVQDGMVKLSWFDVHAPAMMEGDQVLSVRIQARKEVSLRDILAFNSSAIAPEVYDEADAIRDIGLTFTSRESSVFAVHQNRPNPVRGEAVIDYELDRNAKVHMQVHDITGKLIYSAQADGMRGYNQFRVHTGQLQSGVLYYTITDGQHSATRKMVVIR